MERCGIPRPAGRTVFTLDEALQAAQEVGYPVLMRPSYVLGGQNMIVAYNSSDVIEYMGVITKHVDMSHPVLMDKYIYGTECEVDAICDGTDYLVPGIMEQIERTGVHSGDSICVYPPYNFPQDVIDTLVDYTGRFARELKVVGLVNVQYAVQDGKVYVIEVNPRSSRTVPYISKVTGVPMVDLAVRCTLGEKLKDMGYGTGLWRNGKSPYVAVKVPVYSFLKLHGVDTMLGPEMKSTGEVLGIAPNMHEALIKGLVAAGYQFKTPGPGSCVIISVKDSDKKEAAELAWKLHDYGYKIYGTPGTARYLNSQMVPCSTVRQMSEERPNVLDLLEEEPQKVLMIDLKNTGRLARFREKNLEWEKGKCTSFFSCREYLEYCPLDTSKGTGVSCLTKMLNLPLDCTVAVGDEENDIAMLNAAHIGVAVKNATPEVKAAADYVTEHDNNHNAIAEVIERFIL